MLFYKVARWIMKPIYSFLYPTKVIGRENYTHTKAIYICNHYATADSIIIATKLMKKSCNALAKRELFEETRFKTFYLRKLGGIPINRDKLDLNAYKQVISVLESNEPILIFPEGTRNKEGTKEMLPIKNGVAMYAIKTHAPLIPMQFYRQHKKFRKNYLIIGKPIDLSKYYDKKYTNDVKDATNALITDAFLEIRKQVDAVAEKKRLK